MSFHYIRIYVAIALTSVALIACQDDDGATAQTEQTLTYYGADLSYVNQIEEHGGVYKDDGEPQSPYVIFKNNGTNLVRLRLWHNPTWTKEVYGADGKKMYSDLKDVEVSIRRAREQGMEVLLDFHYSDTWADPAAQDVPAAWANITAADVLEDSIYNYTLKTLRYLNGEGLMPELVQIGNETNCGLLFTNAPEGFPTCNVCEGKWVETGAVINRAIDAVRDAADESTIKTKVILHIADPKNVKWFFDNLTTTGGVTDFDIVGFSYYPLWHTTVAPDKLSETIAGFKSAYNKDVMILETAYPWTMEAQDSYTNLFGSDPILPGYSYTRQGLEKLLRDMAQEVHDGGGLGMIYWEPAYISSNMKDTWGTGSSWENCALFDFSGNTIPAIHYMEE
ncbi:glycoside hydrolase family 53 protein [Parachryseolinea silvisoli]|uniref:glycoside hydrolase family 53 protein n=1 Tax=Parachryseolinea silvisoli TaxID=2873601 RepID=UPI002265C4FC|nr:arabinogalactan endo-1,4-beta-galactosidase [Parachryseolinea silvisoli]MCD9018113.1 arabinogalactan endo-1,4-beta-galactosidase [Parachryseolinea silvisoli]